MFLFCQKKAGLMTQTILLSTFKAVSFTFHYVKLAVWHRRWFEIGFHYDSKIKTLVLLHLFIPSIATEWLK